MVSFKNSHKLVFLDSFFYPLCLNISFLIYQSIKKICFFFFFPTIPLKCRSFLQRETSMLGVKCGIIVRIYVSLCWWDNSGREQSVFALRASQLTSHSTETVPLSIHVITNKTSTIHRCVWLYNTINYSRS